MRIIRNFRITITFYEKNNKYILFLKFFCLLSSWMIPCTCNFFEGADRCSISIWKGNLHRIDGPALENFDGTKEWWKCGQQHRLDGPAVEWADGTKEWYIEDRRFDSKEEWFKFLSSEQKLNIIWKFDEI